MARKPISTAIYLSTFDVVVAAGRASDLEPRRDQRRGRQHGVGVVGGWHLDHAQRDQRARRDLVRRLLERREQDEDVQVHPDGQCIRERQRAVARSYRSVPWGSFCPQRAFRARAPARDRDSYSYSSLMYANPRVIRERS